LQDHEKEIYKFAYPTANEHALDAKKDIDWASLRDMAEFLQNCNLELPGGQRGKALSELVGKVFDVYRWAAPSRNADMNKAPRFIRAALQFQEPKVPNGLIGFELIYRPYMKDEHRYASGDAFRSKGRVLVIGEHLYLIGHEDANNYPLVFCCYFSPNRPKAFNGLVLRRKEGESNVFTCNVHFQMNANDQEFNSKELFEKLCISYYDANTTDPEIIEINNILEELRNTASFDGRSALELRVY
jgi:hypothetical protein